MVRGVAMRMTIKQSMRTSIVSFVGSQIHPTIPHQSLNRPQTTEAWIEPKNLEERKVEMVEGAE